MTTFLHHRSVRSAIALSAFVGTFALAGTDSNMVAGAADAPSSTAPKLTTDELLSRIHHTNQMEIEVGKLAESQGQSAKVKSYGAKLLKDHSASDKEILKLAQSEKITLHEPVALNDEEKAKMEKQKATGEKIKELKGAEFDKEFLSAMEDGHDDAIQMLEGAKITVTDAKVHHMVEKLIPILKHHHDMASEIESHTVKR